MPRHLLSPRASAQTETHWVFAYGSNMHHSDLLRWHRQHRRPSPVIYDALPASLVEHRLVWNYRSRTRRGGAANVEPHAGHAVHGLLLEIDTPTLTSLDQKEGHPTVYDRTLHPLSLRSGRTQHAWVYRVTAAHCQSEFVPPHADYLGLMLEIARLYDFEAAYVAELTDLATASEL